MHFETQDLERNCVLKGVMKLVWVIGIAIYLLIGVAILIYGTVTDTYGGLILEFWWLVILFYPYLIVRSLLDR
jgi:hypothetical protein